MKKKEYERIKARLFFIRILFCSLFILIATQSIGQTNITLLSPWTSGLSNTSPSGSNRALLFIAHCEQASASIPTLNSVTYGGIPMVKVDDQSVITTYGAYTAAFYLDEAGIASASGNNLAPSWSSTPSVTGYSSIFLGGVDQSAAIGESSTNSSTSAGAITSYPLTTGDGDMIIVAGTCGNEGSYSVNNGFTKAIENDMVSADAVAGYKFASGADETPSLTHSNVNRNVIIGFVVKKTPGTIESCGEITNNGFENGLDEWTNTGNTTISSDAWTGSMAAITGPNEGGIHYGSEIPVTGGQEITFTAFGKTTGSPIWAGFGLDYYDASGTEIGEILFTVTSSSYSQYTITENAPPGTESVGIWTWKSGSTGYYLLDDFCLSIGNQPEPLGEPHGLSSYNVGQTSFELSRDAPLDSIEITEYEVFSNGLSIGTTASTSFPVTGLECETTYSMTVRASDAAGNWSAESNPLIVTTSDCGGTGIALSVNKNDTRQTIDGFGFFGPIDNWWNSNDPYYFYDDAWLTKIITDLGITIWRNEIYPHNPPTANNTPNQDAYWDKQRPMVQALKAKADANDVDLKIILTVWSPPRDFKWLCDMAWAGDQNATRWSGYVTEKNGGTLNPNMYSNYSTWINQAITMYKNAGVAPYAISLQNEPAFSQSFNSCQYTTYWYNDLINSVVPAVNSAHSDVKIFGTENMLEQEGADNNYPYFYHMALKNDGSAMDKLDILAVHGYSDGVNPSSGSTLAQYWTNHRNQFSQPANKPAWMTETSGYSDSWEGSPGAFSLAMDIHSALYYGDCAAWVWWQGTGPGSIGDNHLMQYLTGGKKYYASKQFYRFIRPGALRVETSSPDNNVFLTAFHHAANNTHTIVILNTASSPKQVYISGSNLPSEYTMYVTSSSQNCSSQGTVPASSITLPARSVVTLQAGGASLKSGNNKTSISDHTSEVQDISFFPNPILKGNSLKITGLDPNKPSTLQVIDPSGKLLISKAISLGETSCALNTTNLSKGLYIINVKNGKQKVTNKLIIE